MRHYQDLNGFTDWFEQGFDAVKKTVSDVSEAVAYGLTSSYDWISNKSSELTAESKATLVEFQKEMENLFKLQSEVDKALATMPEDSPDRKRLEAKKNQARGIFEEYLLPAWKNFVAWSGMEGKDSSYAGMGAVPFGIAVVLGSVYVALKWVKQAGEIEKQILNDPALKKSYAVAKASGFAAMGQNLQYIGWGLGILGAAYLASTMFKRN